MVGFLLIGCAPLIADHFVVTFDIPKQVLNDAWWLTLLTVGFVGISLPLRCGYGLLGSRHRFDIIQIYDTIPIILRLSMIVFLIFIDRLTILYLGSIVYLSNLLGLFLIFRKGLNIFSANEALSITKISRSALYRIISLGSTALILTLSSALLLQGSPMFIGYQIDTRSVTLLTIPIFILLSVTPFFQTFSVITSPIAAATSTNAEIGKLRALYSRTSTYLCSAAFAIFLVYYVFGHIFLEAWLSGQSISKDNIGEMGRVLMILLFGHALSIAGSMSRSILSSIGKHWFAAIADLLISLLGLAVGIILVIYFNMGIIGASLGITIALALRGMLIFPIFIAKYFKISPTKLISGAILRPMAIATIAIIGGEGIHTFCQVGKYSNMLILFMVWIIPALAWMLLTWRYVVRSDHRRELMRKINGIAN